MGVTYLNTKKVFLIFFQFLLSKTNKIWNTSIHMNSLQLQLNKEDFCEKKEL